MSEQSHPVVRPDRPDAPTLPPAALAGRQATGDPVPVEQIGEALVVGPKDFLVIRVEPDTDPDTLTEFHATLVEHMPDVAGRILVVAGVQLAVMRSES